jgi:ATP-GRASP peptide maturase of grasp-with-spasm system
MILIFSNELEGTTSEVLSWLLCFNKKFLLITDKQKLTVKAIRLSNCDSNEMILRVDEQEFSINDVDFFWFRRGFPKIYWEDSSDLFENERSSEMISPFLNREKSVLTHFLYLILDKKPNINTALLTNLNKLNILTRAKYHGFQVPETIVTSNREDLQKFYSENNGKIITKVLSDGLSVEIDKGLYLKTYTEALTKEILENCSERFFPSLFQEEIIKKFEIRTFYLKGEFYSMAIFSQQNSITKIDFRRFENEVVPRTVPFSLPHEYELKLHNFLKEIGLNCCSIDLAYSTNNEFVFFEINPVGQFGMVSYPCNYYLEKRVAEILSEKTLTNQ